MSLEELQKRVEELENRAQKSKVVLVHESKPNVELHIEFDGDEIVFKKITKTESTKVLSKHK